MADLTVNNYRIGVFVHTATHGICALAGWYEIEKELTKLITATGGFAVLPIKLCAVLKKAPNDIHVGFPINVYVIVKCQRLEGLYGKVIGSIDGHVFVQTMEGSLPKNKWHVGEAEFKIFVVKASNLTIWEMPCSPAVMFIRRNYRRYQRAVSFK